MPTRPHRLLSRLIGTSGLCLSLGLCARPLQAGQTPRQEKAEFFRLLDLSNLSHTNWNKPLLAVGAQLTNAAALPSDEQALGVYASALSNLLANLPAHPYSCGRSRVLTDATAFASNFFAWIDLDAPGLETAKANVAVSNYPAALAAWRDYTVLKLRRINSPQLYQQSNKGTPALQNLASRLLGEKTYAQYLSDGTNLYGSIPFFEIYGMSGAPGTIGPIAWTNQPPTADTSLDVLYGYNSFTFPSPLVFRYWRGATVASGEALTLTSAGTLVTARFTSPHGLTNGECVTVFSATPANYNGLFRVTVVNPTNVTYTALSAPGSSPAAGSGRAVARSRETRTLQKWFEILSDYSTRHKNMVSALRLVEASPAVRSQYRTIYESGDWGIRAGAVLGQSGRLSEILAALALFSKLLPEETLTQRDWYATIEKPLDTPLASGALQLIPPESLARIALSLMADTAEALIFAYYRVGMTPNQRLNGLSSLYLLPDFFREFKAAPELQRQTDAALANYAETMFYPDGPMLERSPNYNEGDADRIRALLTLAGTNVTPGLATLANRLDPYQRAFAFMQTPLGYLPRIASYCPPNPPALWQGGPALAAWRATFRASVADATDATSADLYAGLLDSGLPVPSGTSAAFPYAGYYVLRNGWSSRSHFLYFANTPPGNGHNQKDCNGIQVCAFGRSLLATAGPPPYNVTFTDASQNSDYEGFARYQGEGSSFKVNTVAVDGRSQNNGFAYNATVTNVTMPGLWHASPAFDYVEGTYAGGYGNGKWTGYYDAFTNGAVAVTTVTHTRSVAFLRDAGLWVVTDVLASRDTLAHHYRQIWNFPAYSASYGPTCGFATNEVVASDAAQRISTADADGPNVHLYHLGPQQVTYETYSGCRAPYLGWAGNGIGGLRLPAANVHAVWQGVGTQMVVTVIAPSDTGAASPVTATRTHAASATAVDLELDLANGHTLRIAQGLAARTLSVGSQSLSARTVIADVAPDGTQRGFALAASGFAQTNFSFTASATAFTPLSAIRSPTNFTWDTGGEWHLPSTSEPQNSPPEIAPLPTQRIPKDAGPVAIPFFVRDNESRATNLLVSAHSLDQTLLPDSGIVLSGADTNRTVTVTPAAGRFGTLPVDLTATDPQGLSGTARFTLNVFATLYWDTASAAGLQAGSGLWSGSTTNWSASPDGSDSRSAWSNSGNDAVFAEGGSPYAVAVAGTQTVNDLLFSAAGCTVTGGALDHPHGVMTIRAEADATVDTPLRAAAGLVKTGGARLTLGAPCDYPGNTAVNAGTLRIAASNALPAATVLTLGDGQTAGNLVLTNARQTVHGLTFAGTTNAVTSRIEIAAGHTLTVAGTLAVGGVSAGITALAEIAGPGGTFAVTNQGASVQIGMATNVSNNNTATLNLSALGTFIADLGTGGALRVGENFNDKGGNQAALLLAATNLITAGTLGVGEGGRGYQQTLKFGRGATTVNARTINFGTGARDSASVTFATASGTLTVRGEAGSGRAALNLGTGGTTSGSGASNLLDLRGHACDLLLSTLTIGDQLRSSSPTHTLYFDAGLLDADAIVMARTQGTGTGTSTLAVSGGSVNVGAGGILLASNAVGNLTLTGGTLFTDGDILKGRGGTGTATLTLNGAAAILDLNRHAIGSAAAPVNARLIAGTLRNVGEFNGGADFVKGSDTVLVLDGTNTCSGRTLVSNGTLRVAGSLANGSAVDVAGPATLDLAGSLTAGTVLIRTNAHLLSCGTLSGTLIVEAGGSVDSGCGGTWAMDGAVTNNGVITATGGTAIHFSQKVVNNGLIDVRSGYARFSAGVTGGGTVLGTFDSDTTSRGTPFAWLDQNGLVSGGDYEAADAADTDGDGVANWREYQAETDPLTALSRPGFNAVPYAESFENLAGWGGVYTSVFPFMGWSSSVPAEDKSRLVRLDYAYEKTRPLPSSTHTNVLRLETARAVLTNSFGAGFDMGSAVTRVDLMMKFRLSDRVPDELTFYDAGIKSAVYADESGFLTVYHGVAAPDGTLLSNTVSTTGFRIDSNLWHRVTLTVDATATNVALFGVRVDGVTVTNRNAYPAGWKAQFLASGQLPPAGAGGNWFRLASTNLRSRLLTGVAFSGSGYVDDLAVKEEPAFVVLSVARTGSGRSSLGAGALASAEIPTGAETQIVYTADDWHRLSALEANGEAVPGATGARAYTQEFASVTEDISNAVAFAEALPAQTGYAAVPTGWLMNWDEQAVLAGDSDAFDVPTEYRLGLSPVSPNTFGFVIESVDVSGSQLVTVVRRAVTGELSPDGMHGTLVLRAAESLGAGFTNIAATAVTGGTAFDAQGRRAYTNTVNGASRFFRAVIE